MDADRITSAKLQALLGVGKVALNDLAKRGGREPMPCSGLSTVTDDDSKTCAR
jgi:hypothetical protein